MTDTARPGIDLQARPDAERLPGGVSPDPSLKVGRPVGSMLEPLIAALRWCAVVLGTALAAPGAVDGDVGLIIAMSVCLDITAWRTMRPLRLGSPDRVQRLMSVTDVILLGAAAGVNDGLESPFLFSVSVAAAVAGFGWGARRGVLALASGLAAALACATIAGGSAGLDSDAGRITVLMSLVVVPTCGAIRVRLEEAEQHRSLSAGRIAALAETNELLHVLNRVARTLPTSLDLQHTITTTRNQLLRAFEADVVAILTVSEANDSWAPLLAEGTALAPAMTRAEIPRPLGMALLAKEPVLRPELDGDGLGPASRSGMYVALRTRGKTVGLLGIEHSSSGRFGEREVRLLGGLAEALALTIDNSRWYRRLRILGADEERARIARDLHDRLGQWLTYISLELERIKSSPPETDRAAELDALHQDVQRAIDELRETLRQMRTAVTDERSLAEVASELIDRFAARTGIAATFTAPAGVARLPVPVENELLLILQEALNNVDRHADATEVEVEWTVDDKVGHFRISDDGIGFDHAKGVRETAFGLVGMRERAEVIDSRLAVTSAPGAGTTIDVIVPREEPA